MCIQIPSKPQGDYPNDLVGSLEAELVRGIEVCPLCDLSDVVACPACDGRGWIVFDSSNRD